MALAAGLRGGAALRLEQVDPTEVGGIDLGGGGGFTITIASSGVFTLRRFGSGSHLQNQQYLRQPLPAPSGFVTVVLQGAGGFTVTFFRQQFMTIDLGGGGGFDVTVGVRDTIPAVRMGGALSRG